RMLTRGQLRVNLDLAGTADPLEDLARIANRLTMSVIVAGLFIGSSVVYYARIQPVIFGIPIIGFLGYLAAFVLGVWVAVDIIRESRRRRRR
ncbi:MAG TPA: ABC transporter, partial [Olsenella sp.]|nr:ABC transporter [Olsenella sp.]